MKRKSIFTLLLVALASFARADGYDAAEKAMILELAKQDTPEGHRAQMAICIHAQEERAKQAYREWSNSIVAAINATHPQTTATNNINITSK